MYNPEVTCLLLLTIGWEGESRHGLSGLVITVQDIPRADLDLPVDVSQAESAHFISPGKPRSRLESQSEYDCPAKFYLEPDKTILLQGT